MKPVARSRLLIVGASARAAAHSAVRAGLRPICADLFGDDDLLAVAEVLPVEKYPHGLPAAARRAPACPWMYTGALENHPGVVAAVSGDRPLWGNPPEVLAAVRDPFQLHARLAAADLPALTVRPATEPPPPDGRWLIKPLKSAGGRRIGVWTAESQTPDEPYYFQEKSPGTPLSALFLAAAGRSWLIGITRQFVGAPSLAAPPFGYCGSVGPIELSGTVRRQIRRTGEVLAEQCGLRGLFGGDFLCDHDAVRLTEINPRYTASVEIVEQAFGVPLLDWHRWACDSFVASRPPANPSGATLADLHSAIRNVGRICNPSNLGDGLQIRPTDTLADLHSAIRPARIVGKVILFAERELTTSSLNEFCEPATLGTVPFVADVPAAGSVIGKGQPLCTVFAADATPSRCFEKLASRVRDVSLRLTGRSVEIAGDVCLRLH